MKIDLLVTFSVTKEENSEASRAKVADILIDNEEIELAYSMFVTKFGLPPKES
ncbi:hypothetical protein [Zobellia sp. B3R18]|uniref:hypothetical protein n=1 Tax=Zobellia sp. B3R18 TaxID=2841568 RepID=UPI001C0771EF|nr:hypothetical protein [Zobellia sp. B3R18]MBU2973197.1 hypothetical protein [Zobellia sp. B3R18]